MLETALAYAARGWQVLPLHTIQLGGGCSCGKLTCDRNAGKHPIAQLVPHGLTEATSDVDTIRRWWTAAPSANIGIRTGRVSGIVAIDVDVAHHIGHFGDETWRALEELHGKVPATVEAITGSGGRHILFAYPEDAELLLSKSNALGPHVDSRADGGYIVVAPSLHRSGSEYTWEASSHPDDTELAPLPDWIRVALTESVAPASILPEETRLEPDRVRELRSALAVIPSDERDTWLRVGMALHSTGAGQQAFGIWTEWSQTSDKYEPTTQVKTWSAFKSDRGKAVTAATIFAIAKEHGWVPVETPALVLPEVRAFALSLMDPTVAAPAIVHRVPDPPAEIPAELLTPPGILGDVARYGVESAVRPVPIFAVQAALALGSVVCGRRFVTNHRNYASIYLLNVAKSGTGKEEAKTTVETILGAAGMRKLIGGSSYTSGNAVFSALLRKPQHLTIIDEFGKYLEAASGQRDSFRADALTQLMEAFGRVHADMATPQFSSMTLSAKAAVDMEPKVIQRPAITLLAMTTPSSFYAAMRSSRVLDGFLNRFLVVEHVGPRMPMADWADVPVPERVVAWVQSILAPRGNMDQGTPLDHLADPEVVAFTGPAMGRAKAFERDMLALADRLDIDGLGDMPLRTREIGMRLALIAALAESPESPSITADLIDWCFSYVRFFLDQTVTMLRDRVADSSVERVRNTIYSAIKEAGAEGVANRDLHRGKRFISIPKRERMEAIESLLQAELVMWTEITGGGRPRKALVAVAQDDPHQDDPSVLPFSKGA